MAWTVIEIHSGETVTEGPNDDPVLFDNEQGAWDWAIGEFGPEAGREYNVKEV